MTAWFWEILYTDGTVLSQYEKGGVEHHFPEIDQSRIKAVYMVSPGKTPVILKWAAGRKLILFTKNLIQYSLGGGGEERKRIQVMGYQSGSEKVMIAVMPDDAVIVTDDIDRLKVS